jgi:hypothetical protein
VRSRRTAKAKNARQSLCRAFLVEAHGKRHTVAYRTVKLHCRAPSLTMHGENLCRAFLTAHGKEKVTDVCEVRHVHGRRLGPVCRAPNSHARQTFRKKQKKRQRATAVAVEPTIKLPPPGSAPGRRRDHHQDMHPPTTQQHHMPPPPTQQHQDMSRRQRRRRPSREPPPHWPSREPPPCRPSWEGKG